MKVNYIITGLYSTGKKLRVAFEAEDEARFVYYLLTSAGDERKNLSLWRLEDNSIILSHHGLTCDDYRRLGI